MPLSFKPSHLAHILPLTFIQLGRLSGSFPAYRALRGTGELEVAHGQRMGIISLCSSWNRNTMIYRCCERKIRWEPLESVLPSKQKSNKSSGERFPGMAGTDKWFSK